MPNAAGDAADAIGYPVVAKLYGDAIAHKTERGLVRLGLADADAVEAAAAELLAAATPDDGDGPRARRADAQRATASSSPGWSATRSSARP